MNCVVSSHEPHGFVSFLSQAFTHFVLTVHACQCAYGFKWYCTTNDIQVYICILQKFSYSQVFCASPFLQVWRHLWFSSLSPAERQVPRFSCIWARHGTILILYQSVLSLEKASGKIGHSLKQILLHVLPQRLRRCGYEIRGVMLQPWSSWPSNALKF